MVKSYFKQNHCHTCHTRFAVFFPLLFTVTASILQWSVAFLYFLLRGSLGLVLNALGVTRSCDCPVRHPPFFLQAPVDWFGLVPLRHRVVMVTFQAQLQCLSDLLRTFPTLIYCHWPYMFLHLVNVAKCYSGSGLHH